jgi:hypothetical protein
MQRYERAFARLAPEEKEVRIEMMSSWEMKGRQEGRQQGMEHVVLRLLRQRLGDLPAEVERRIDELTPEQIDALTDTLFDIHTVEQVDAWLARHNPQ